MTPRQQIAALVAVAVIAYYAATLQQHSTPTPAPIPEDSFVLKGKFIGPTASSDAANVAALTDELGYWIEYDGMQPEPRLKTGVAFDELRIAAREGRMKGVSIGARQPKVKAAIEEFMTKTTGTYGGPIGPADRSNWVSSLKTISRAAAEAAR